MTRAIGALVSLALAVTLVTEPSYGCSKQFGPPFWLRSDTSVVVGRVLSYTDPIRVEGSLPEHVYFGLNVLVDTVFQGEQLENKTIQVYPTVRGPSCLPSPLPPNQLRESYPVGTIVRVVGRPHLFCLESDGQEEETGRLFGEPVAVSPALPADPDPRSSVPIDYRSLVASEEPLSLETLYFEVAKDCVRIANANRRPERIAIADRMIAAFPNEPAEIYEALVDYESYRDEILKMSEDPCSNRTEASE